MKFIGIIVIAAAIIMLPYAASKFLEVPHQAVVTKPTPTPQKDTFKKINFNNKIYRYDYFTTSQTDTLKLINNVANGLSSQQLIDEKTCKYFTNAGFYTKNLENIGKLSIDGEVESHYQKNQLFNGFLHATKSGQVVIERAGDLIAFENGFQSGPLLFEKKDRLTLAMKNDEHERRMVAITTTDQKTVFMALLGESSQFEGPLLGDLPKIIEQIALNESFQIESAMNLDGGTASVFFNQQNYLKELKPVGTFLCFN